jgi:hypothetical protein
MQEIIEWEIGLAHQMKNEPALIRLRQWESDIDAAIDLKNFPLCRFCGKFPQDTEHGNDICIACREDLPF